jgi:hypothetical protein
MKNIFRFGRFILEAVKDDIGEFGWKEITSTDFYSGNENSAEYEELIKDELYYLNEFVSKWNLELSDTWNSNSTIKVWKQGDFEIVILKKSDEWFNVRLTFTEPFFYRPNGYYIADQRDGLQNLLSEILENRV